MELAQRQICEPKERSRFPAREPLRDELRCFQAAHHGFEFFPALVALVFPGRHLGSPPEGAEDRRAGAGLGFLEESGEKAPVWAYLRAWRVASPGGLYRGPVLPAPRASRGGW